MNFKEELSKVIQATTKAMVSVSAMSRTLLLGILTDCYEVIESQGSKSRVSARQVDKNIYIAIYAKMNLYSRKRYYQNAVNLSKQAEKCLQPLIELLKKYEQEQKTLLTQNPVSSKLEGLLSSQTVVPTVPTFSH